MSLEFFIHVNPPTATAQEKQVRAIHGRMIFYDPEPVKAARKLLTTCLMPFKPEKPFEGPLQLTAIWLFPIDSTHKVGEWRTTRPDTDNLQKLLKDCLTRCGFWKDDAQVVREIVEKRWSDHPVGIRIIIQSPDSSSDSL